MTDRTFEINKNLMCFLLVLVILCTVFVPVQGVAFAVEESGSNVLVDLNNAENFNVDDYPYNPTDNSLHVIHVAESTDKELLVYVYQPTGDSAKIKASSISISTALDNKNIKPDLYGLEFLNCSGVFYKYKVKDFVVSDSTTRVYSIVSILRPFIDGADEEAGFDNTISEVPYPVAKEFIFYSGQDDYQMQVLDVVEITDKFVGYVIYSDGVDWYGYDPYFDAAATWYVTKNSHIVAFSTDKDIDKLLEAEVYYEHQTYHHSIETGFKTEESKTFGDVLPETVVLSSEDKLTYNGEGLLYASGIDVGRIQTVDEFINSVNINEQVYSGAIVDVSVSSKLTESAKVALTGKEWVLRFADTESREATDINGFFYYYSTTSVFNVSVLRLKFITDDETYNLGVVDNKQTGSDKPINEWEYNVDFKLPSLLDGLKDIWKMVLLVIFIILMLPVVYYVLKFVVWVFKSIVKAAKKNKEKKRKKKE